VGGGKVPAVPPDARSDRYEPLPGLTEIPAYLIRKLSPRGRKIAVLVGVAMLLLVAVGLAISIPRITDTKADRAAADRAAAAKREAALVAQLKAEQRLREGTGAPSRGLEGAAAIEARRQLATQLAAAVKGDALQRVRTGELARPVARVECERYPRGARGEDPATDLSSPTGRYSCLAITADAPETAKNNPSSIGYPYRAAVDFPSGHFTYCKVSGRPGEGSLTREVLVRVPAACGG
jgi:hypothetical protein